MTDDEALVIHNAIEVLKKSEAVIAAKLREMLAVSDDTE